MANSICVIGDSGSGKTTSIGQIPELGMVGLNPEETFLINVKGKPLPIRGWKAKYVSIDIAKPPIKGNYLETVDPALIIKTMRFISANRPEIKNVVLDDYQYVMSEQFMDKALQTGYEKFNILAKNAYDILNAGISMRSEINFIVLTHDDEENGRAKMKTLGDILPN